MRQLWLSVVLVVAAVVHIHVVRSQDTSDTNNNSSSSAAKGNATYWLTTSNKLWPGRPLKVIAQVLSGLDPVLVTVSINYETYDINSTTQTLLTSDPFQVYPGEPKTLQVDIPLNITVSEESWYGTYKIIVVGKSPAINFKHEDYIFLQNKVFSVYLVTDKAIYKPGQTVKFRALAIEPENLKVLQNVMDIYITDAKGNRIKQYLGVTGTAGVVDDSFQLASSTPTGDWTIAATVRGQTEQKTFTVDNYVVPKYEVVVTPPAIPLSSDLSFPITINAKYTFGQPVTEGKVDVLIILSGNQLDSNGWRTKGKLDSHGEFTFQVTAKELVSVAQTTVSYIYSLDGWQFEVKANVTEGVTQRVQTGSAVMQIYSSPLSIQIVPITPTSYKPGMPYTVYTEVKNADGTSLSPQQASNLKVNFNVNYDVPIPEEERETTPPPNVTDNTNSSTNKIDLNRIPYPSTKSKVLVLDNSVQTVSEAGFANITFVVPADALYVNVVATFEEPYNNTSAYHTASPFMSPSNNYIQLWAPLKPPKVGDTITLRIASTEPVKNLLYQVLSKGTVVSNGTVLSPTTDGSKTLSFDLEITQAMSPSMTIIAFYIREQNSEFVADAVSISINGLFQKPVSIEFNKDKVEPGESLNIVVRAEPDSTVFIQANDKSIELLKSGNKLTQDMVRDDLAEYSYGSIFPWTRYMFICGWPSTFGGTTAASLIEQAGMHLFSDVELMKEPLYSLAVISDKGGMNEALAVAAPAPSGDITASGLQEPERVRKLFPENWIWSISVVPADSNGIMEIPVTAPDTISSFLAGIFSVHPDYGLSVGQDIATVTVFRELFVSVDLPPYIIRYEDFCFTASVFSYYHGEIPVFLKLDSSDQYNGSYPKRQGNSVTVVKEKMGFTDFYPDVTENQVRSSIFCFTPIVTGDVTLRVSALTTVKGLSDAVDQVISVKPEGVARSNNYPFLVNLTSSFWQQEVKISFPPETVPDSQQITVSIAGNLMGSILENIDDLLRQPYGCGEQNMVNFAPSISLLQFFLVTDTATPEIKQQAINYIITGYQTEVTYEHDKTGGFSAFGSQDKNASTWLTAFVLKSLSKAFGLNVEYDNFLGINMTDVIIRSSRYIISNQNKNGSFTEYGIVFHKEMQGGSAQGEALSAYSLIALAEAKKTVEGNSTFVEKLQNSINLATEYLVGRISYLTDPFDICITTYALHFVNHPSKDSIFAKMEEIAQTGDGLRFWKRANSLQENYAVYAWSISADSISIEMTSYALLTYVLRGTETTNGLPIIRWLTNQRGPNGGFVATQDTVIGLEALASAVTKFYKAGDYSVTLTVSYIDGDGQSQADITRFNKASEMLLQKVYIQYKNNAPRSLTLTANTNDGQPGPSTLFADVNLDYNVKNESRAICYDMSHDLVRTAAGWELTINIAAVTDNVTSMSILEVQILPGYTVDPAEVAKNDNVSLVDPYNGQKLVIYYDSGVITRKGISVTIKMSQGNNALTEAKPRSYTISDYYQTNCRQTKSYMLDIDPYCDTAPNSGVCAYMQADDLEETFQ